MFRNGEEGLDDSVEGRKNEGRENIRDYKHEVLGRSFWGKWQVSHSPASGSDLAGKNTHKVTAGTKGKYDPSHRHPSQHLTL